MIKTSANRKKNLLNLLMVLAVAMIAAAGILAVGSLKGWFDGAKTVPQADGATLCVTVRNKIGSANIERGGVSYSLQDGTAFRSGDRVETLNGSAIEMTYGGSVIALDENTQVTLHIQQDSVTAELENGGVFARAAQAVTLRVMGTDVFADNAVFSAGAHSGSANLYVLRGKAQAGGQTLQAGKAVSLLADGLHTTELSAQALNAFELSRIAKSNEADDLCFTNEQLAQLAAHRQDNALLAQQAQQLEDMTAQQIEQQRQENKDKLAVTGGKREPSSAQGGATSAPGGAGDAAPQCTIEIRCDTILNNMSALTEGKNKYVPASGRILSASKLTFTQGETVFDVLKRACSLAGIQLEYSWTPLYNSYYIEGINQLYEFDCGDQSGWMYQVNGWFPNYGCSAYSLKDGDVIVWAYTCKGLGADVGGSVN
ncbi:MAG: DUF4430 domain-containing protein [Eubacteriales bacterium]|nr:DUF4430 domain-containing protein [Eubacteriales bacterium]